MLNVKAKQAYLLEIRRWMFIYLLTCLLTALFFKFALRPLRLCGEKQFSEQSLKDR